MKYWFGALGALATVAGAWVAVQSPEGETTGLLLVIAGAVYVVGSGVIAAIEKRSKRRSKRFPLDNSKARPLSSEIDAEDTLPRR